ncbi:50S ribosomal protein L13 [Candidatus Woesearchaeota archaeon]|nr:50S ribosomal protein L13 [Candidatus Woesearchaeota archaeon]
MRIYNAEGMIIGRLATLVAKDALLGEEVRIINCEKALISGAKENTLAREKQRRLRKGYPLKAQTISRLADRHVRRTVRGMLPWKFTRGREAYKRVLCYIGVPAEFEGKTTIPTPKASSDKLPTLKYITIGEMCKRLGAKQ